MAISDFFSQIHYIVVETTLLLLAFIGAYKLIRNEWPRNSRRHKR